MIGSPLSIRKEIMAASALLFLLVGAFIWLCLDISQALTRALEKAQACSNYDKCVRRLGEVECAARKQACLDSVK